jgi:glycosyltransferase involved in cell wall biosynthesis
MTRILFVDHAPFIGGAQLVLAEHIEELDRSRFTPLVACTSTVPALVARYRDAGAHVITLPMGRLKAWNPAVPVRLLRAAYHLRRAIHTQKVDLVVANTARASYIASLAVMGTRVGLIWWVRDFLFQPWLFQRLQGSADRIICVSEAIRDHYEGTNDARFAVVHVGSSLHRGLEQVSAEAVRRERERWGFEANDIVVGFMGRLVNDKGPQDVLSAVKQLHGEFPRLKAMIVGTGGNQEGDIEAELRRRVEREDLGSVVKLTGYQSDEPLYYKMMDIYILPTRTAEPYATSVVQAMMARLPVIATATGGTPELVRHRENGLLVPPENPGRLAEAVTVLLRDPDLADTLAASGHLKVMAENRESVTTRQVERLYDAAAFASN